MAKIAFILLCHKDPDAIIAQAERLTATGDYLAIHFDRRSPAQAYDRIKSALSGNPNVVFARRRIKCGWGEWSLVQATLNTVRVAAEAFPRATHFYMLSGDCMPTKTAEYAHDFLDEEHVDYIETHDFFESDWIKTGFKEERLIYRHWFNERKRKWLFYRSIWLQRYLNWTREVPDGIRVAIGSQWWCLRRRTVEAILDFTDSRPDVLRFFKTTWIPDETYFQTLVRHLIPKVEIRNRTLTFLMFSDYGMPVNFYDDHFDLLLAQDFLFARKISPGAKDLRRRLGTLYSETGRTFAVSNEGQNLLKFVTGRGRIGRRFEPRIWESGGRIGRERTLHIVTCKKWHVAKRLVEKIRQFSANKSTLKNLSALDYVFNELSADLPDLGGIETDLKLRNRHRRALIRMVYDVEGTNRLVLCLDPSALDIIKDFYSDSAKVRLLEVDCTFTDDYLLGHAMRVGLAGEMTPKETISRLLPTIRADFNFEGEQIRDADLPDTYRIREKGSVEENAFAIAQFLDISEELAEDIARTDHLFAD